MSDIALRARRYAERISAENAEAYIFTDVEILVEEAYEQGARDERMLTKQNEVYGMDQSTNGDKSPL